MKNLLHFVLLVVTTLLFLIDSLDGQACSTKSVQSGCNGVADGYCAWDSGNSRCECGNSMSQDIIFLIDESDNLDDTDFGYVKTFVTNMLYHASPTTSRVGLALMTDTNRTILSITDGTTPESAVTSVSSLTRTGGNSDDFDVQNSLIWAQDEFSKYSSTQRMTLFVIVGSESRLTPCQSSIAPNTLNIDTYVIAIGSSWVKKAYRCLAKSDNDFEGLIQVEESSSLPDSSFQETAELFSCPHNPLITITEVEPQTSSGTRFFEFYNKGESITASLLSFTGLFSGDLSSSTTISQGSYVVIYDGTSSSDPTCTNCDCTLTSSSWCNDANYFGCGINNDDSWEDNTISCSFGSGSSSSWSITVSYDSTSVDSVTLGSAGASGDLWMGVSTDYTWELINPGYYNLWGSSWVMSCNANGTPGEGILSTCSSVCTTSTCQLDDASATCSTSCSCSSGYYPYNSLTCNLLPTPDNCTGIVYSSFTTTYYIDQPDWDGYQLYAVSYCDGVSATPVTTADCTYQDQNSLGLALSINKPYEGWDISPGNVSLRTSNGELSPYTSCSVETLAPTSSPTSAPTYVVNSVSSCNYTLDGDLEGYSVYWTEIETTSLSTPPDGYRIYDSGSGGYTPAPTCCYHYVDTFGDPFIIGTDLIHLTGNWDDSLPGFSTSTIEATKTLCNEFTQEPTFSPTNTPTFNPTAVPTDLPTRQPTQPPTYKSLNITSCSITIVGSIDITNDLVGAIVDWSQPIFINDTTATLADTKFYLNYSTQINERAFTGIGPSSSINLSPIPNFNDPFYMYCTWFTDQFKQPFDTWPQCTLTTDSPTNAPTGEPTYSPTKTPTDDPTSSPSYSPTMEPTPCPTYSSPNLTWCDAVIGNGNDHIIILVELFSLDSNYISTPSSDDVQYTFEINGVKTYVLQSQIDIIDSSDPYYSNSYNGSIVGIRTIYLSSLFDPGDNSSTVSISISFVGGCSSVYSDGPIYCPYETSAPTVSPTPEPTFEPTLSPTYGGVHVYFSQLDECDVTRCGCTDWLCKNFSTPVQVVKETDQSTQDFQVQRSISSPYPYNISIMYKFDYVTEGIAKQYGFEDFIDSLSNFSTPYKIPNASYWENTDLSKIGYGPNSRDIAKEYWNGTFMITSDSSLGSFPVQFEKESDIISTHDYEGEVFLLSLISCWIDPVLNPGLYNNDNMSCILSYPNKLFIIIEDTNSYTEVENQTTANDSYQDWFWWVLLGIVIVLLIAAYFVYRWWVNKKMKEAEVKDIEEDVDAVIEEQERGFGNDLNKDQVNFNPLAKPLSHLQRPDGTDANARTNEDGEIQDRAQVRVEKFNVRQEFGPTQATHHYGTGDQV